MGALCGKATADDNPQGKAAAYVVTEPAVDGTSSNKEQQEKAHAAKMETAIKEYTGAPLPPNEESRMCKLKSLAILDTVPEKRFDDITSLCCMIFKVPICLVSLVDSERQWFKSEQGIPGVTETDRKSSFCAWTLLPSCPTVLVVENALEDPRFCANSLVVGWPHIRFYAGTPLVASDGHRLGSLCLIDTKPTKITAEACAMLTNFGEMVVREIEKETMLEKQQQESAALSEEKTRLIRAMNMFNEAIMLCNFSEESWPVVFVNDAWEGATGIKKDTFDGSPSFWDCYQLVGGDDKQQAVREAYLEAVAKQQNFNMAVSHKAAGLLFLQFRCANNSNMTLDMPAVAIPATAPNASPENSSCFYYATLRKDVKQRGESIDSAASLRSFSTISSSLLFSPVDDHMDAFEDVKLGSMLGHGSFGRVYRGLWNNTPVAIKVLEHNQKDDGMHLLEALLSEKIAHPNVVRTYKHSTRAMPMAHQSMDDNEGSSLMETWMIMEFCNKGTLSDAAARGLFRRKNSVFEIDYAVLLSAAKDVASALFYLHSLDIIHGDLTGSNVLLAEKDEDNVTAKVADFGFSRVMSTCDIKTMTHGAVSHTAPELLVDGLLSKAADVYAFGVIVWEMYMGQPPYRGLTPGQIINHISNRRGLSVNSDCPAPVRKLIQRCCNPKHDARPTMEEVLAELEQMEEELCEM